ncbi:hypothetical protein L198_07838 [Cryptococcus wingfieldii CBS 7118]|uniref:Uncharacterized protein n=1 Tax=Cryptococcus wingfieldii CBS 7118 TaxID=1295528 RepID=A0A1E3HV09_9TREE|nr:hypothetical protein L198_07838 [Cryptococcus wingfieldii CBS 7118]ODN80182.1 hypothetical protein L198_07838 [Cryptococcus wingfieldii CBS 7118]
MLSAPLHCSICAIPCLLPRNELPPPKASFLADSLVSPSKSSGVGATCWLNEWYCLRVSSGIVRPEPFLPPTPPISPTSKACPSPGQTGAKTKRCVPIHAYCLLAILSTIRQSQFNNAQTHEEKMMIEWSLPRWSGFGPWVRKGDEEGEGAGGGLSLGHWRGLVSQRERWEMEGKHYLDSDLLSPFDVGEPSSTDPLPYFRPLQTSILTTLPYTIIYSIFLSSLENPDLPDVSQLTSSPTKTLPKLLNPSAINDFLSLARTCSDLWHYPLSSNIWALLVLDDVRRWKVTTLSRWRANPSGVGSALHLSDALDASFVDPIIKSLGASREEGAEWKAKDVWSWWKFGNGWKSRRRVWYCVVHGCATARDADWW